MASYLLREYLSVYVKKKCPTGNILDAIRTKKHTHIRIVDLLVPFTYMKHGLKKNHVFLYSSVKASQAMTDTKEVWIAIHKKSQTENKILCAWCSCMAGVYETCNHVIASLYKIDYANKKNQLAL